MTRRNGPSTTSPIRTSGSTCSGSRRQSAPTLGIGGSPEPSSVSSTEAEQRGIGHNVGMRRIHRIVGIGALLVIAASAAPTPEVETRIFEGAGSVGTDSTLELYLLEGTYHHRLASPSECFISASLFPSRGSQGVPLSDVLDADLSVGTRSGSGETSPTGAIVISQAGWTNLQVGTGTDCEWTYSITGRFLPEGEEPVPPSERNQWWLIVAGVIAVAALVVLVLRRRPPAPPTDGEDAIRVLDGSSP